MHNTTVVIGAGRVGTVVAARLGARLVSRGEDPDLGECPYEGYPPKLSRTPAFVHGRAPTLAEHNQYVYGELLDMSATEIAGLRERGVI